MSNLFIIGDIAGQYDALMRLVEKVPTGSKIVLVGDLVDRGPKSRDVIEWAMKGTHNGHEIIALMGNHEHMMLDYYNKNGIYWPDDWLRNGGINTMANYGGNSPPQEQLNWLQDLPLILLADGIVISHAPLKTIPDAIIEDDLDFLWNRGEPTEVKGLLQVFGHQSQLGLTYFINDEKETWAICIDQSRKNVLTAFEWPSMKIIVEPY